jgi:hypothetical protein
MDREIPVRELRPLGILKGGRVVQPDEMIVRTERFQRLGPESGEDLRGERSEDFRDADEPGGGGERFGHATVLRGIPVSGNPFEQDLRAPALARQARNREFYLKERTRE